MKDLDFDELDRAVNSLMTNIPKTPEPKKPEENTLTITPTIKDSADPVSFATLDRTVAELSKTTDSTPSVSTSATDTTVTPSPSVAQDRSTSVPPPASRRGRFMDMVRPAAASTKPEAVARPMSRLGATIEPTGPLMADVIAPSAPSSSSVSNVKDTVKLDAEGDWPDPLEMSSAKDGPKLLDEAEDRHDVELLEAKNPVEEDASSSNNFSPLVSPFLSDAKVEKRPLGGTAPTSEVSTESTTRPASEVPDDIPIISNPSAQLPANPTDISQPPLPEELSGDLMAIESGANTLPAEPDSISASVLAAQNVSNIKSIDQKPVVTKPSADASAGVEKDDKPTPSGPISIPQQYHEQPSTGDQGNGSIYDINTYHQPLTHPAKKKSGWLWVLWIVIILALGAGGGAALLLTHIV